MMHRWPYNQTVRNSSVASIVLPVTLEAPWMTSEGFVEAGTNPQRIITPSDSLSCIRAAGILCVTATLNRVEKVHQGLLTLSSCSTSSRSGITNRSHIARRLRGGEPIG